MATFSFTLTAPPTAATVTLFAAGLSGSGGNAEMGDMAGTATLDITIGDGALQAPVSPTPVPVQSPRTGGLSGGVVEGGCSVTGGLPFAVLALAALLSFVRRGATGRRSPSTDAA
jgi:hypothetical protein